MCNEARRLLGAILIGVCTAPALAWENVLISDLAEEIRLSEVVVRGRVEQVLNERFTCHAFSQHVVLRVSHVYKGHYREDTMKLFLGLPVVETSDKGHHVDVEARNREAGRPRLAAVPGDDLIVPVTQAEIVIIPKSELKPGEPDSYYLAPSFYRIRDGQVVGSPFSLSKELAAHSRLEAFERLMARLIEAERQASPPAYRLGKVLFFDDFDDNSTAGWTFLVGHRGAPEEIDSFYGEKWVGPGLRWTHKYPKKMRGRRGRLTQDPQTGNYEGVLDMAKIQIGAYDGRLRLRCSRLWHHVTVVAGDPSWTDYQVECDVINYNDKLLSTPQWPETIAQESYLEFGLYGRVNVPNFPETRGEHSLIAFEFGPYSNEMTMVPLWTQVPRRVWHNLCQIRVKWPDPEGGREASFWNKKTRILATKAYHIPQNKRIRLKARFMGNRVEAYIDDVKYLDATLDPLPELFRRGRIALWTFETWAEFDNVKVTELIPVQTAAKND